MQWSSESLKKSRVLLTRDSLIERATLEESAMHLLRVTWDGGSMIIYSTMSTFGPNFRTQTHQSGCWL